MYFLVAKAGDKPTQYLSEKLSMKLPLDLPYALYSSTLTDMVNQIIIHQLGTEVPITPKEDFYEVSEKALLKIQKSIDCANKELAEFSPLLAGETIVEDFYTYLATAFAGLPAGIPVLHRQTNKALLFYFFVDLMITPEGLIARQPSHNHFRHLIVPPTLELPLEQPIIDFFVERNMRALPQAVHLEAYTVDTNKIVENTVRAGASLIPGIGGILSLIINAFWPSSGPNFLAIWNGIKSYVRQMVGKLIANALAKFTDAVLTNKLQGIKNDITNYNTLTLDDPTLMSNLTSTKNIVLDQAPFFIGPNLFGKSVENPVQYLTFMVSFGTIYLSVLKEDLIIFSFLFPNADDLKTRTQQFNKALNDIVAQAKKVKADASNWRSNQFDVGDIKQISVDKGQGKNKISTTFYAADVTDLQNTNVKGQARVEFGDLTLGVFQIIVSTNTNGTWIDQVVFSKNINRSFFQGGQQAMFTVVNALLDQGTNTLVDRFNTNAQNQINTFFEPTKLWPEFIYEALYGVHYLPAQSGISTKEVSTDDLSKASGITAAGLSDPQRLISAAYKWSVDKGFLAGFPTFQSSNEGNHTLILFDKTTAVQILSPTTKELQDAVSWATPASFKDSQAMFAMATNWSANYKVPDSNITLNSAMPLFLNGTKADTHLVLGFPDALKVTYRNGYSSMLSREFAPNINTDKLKDFGTLMQAVNLQAATITKVKAGDFIAGLPTGFVGNNRGRGTVGVS